MSEKQKEYLTTREAAEMLGVAVSTIQLWTNKGSLRAWTTGGGHRRIIYSSVRDMLKQRISASRTHANHDKQFSVVVVEDNAQQLRMYEKQLNSWCTDINFIAAKDGYEGLVKIGQSSPRIIITDLRMPNMDGFQMIKALKKMPELDESTIIVVSGLTHDEIEEKGGLPEGVQLFIKPIPFEKVENIVREKLAVEIT
ncbi:MAG: response regulator [Sulfuriflexus sp.]|nr:response regulator [Sulfuriflexus sp.]